MESTTMTSLPARRTGRRTRRLVMATLAVAALGAAACSPVKKAPPPEPAPRFEHHSVTFNCTDEVTTWEVPAGATEATFDAYGAAGGDGWGDEQQAGSPGGPGGRVTATMGVTPDDSIGIRVGCRGGDADGGTGGAGGFPNSPTENQGGTVDSPGGGGGGGGGGYSIVELRGDDVFDVWWLRAGGGGGGAGRCNVVGNCLTGAGTGGAGGHPTATNGGDAFIGTRDGGGGGGTSPAPGGAGGCPDAGPGGLPYGGSAASTTSLGGGGGGGGGWSGGGAGCSDGGGGGGGASHARDVPGATFETGVNSGDGRVVISWTRPIP